jgi:hypothetical protein
MMKSPTSNDIRCDQGDQELMRNCYTVVVRGTSQVVQVDQKISSIEEEGRSTELIEAIEIS